MGAPKRILGITLAVGCLLAGIDPVVAASAPDRGAAFQPRPQSKELYGTKPPDADPSRQRHYVTARDGAQIFVETWLPSAEYGAKPPRKLPTILVASPYPAEGQERYAEEQPHLIGYFTSRGYAVAQSQIRGNYNSGGCIDQTGPLQIDDTARVIEYLGRDAPWSNGSVGMYGRSYDAEAQIAVAGLGDRKRIKYLKAIVPASSVGGQYEWSFMDGVRWGHQPASGHLLYFTDGIASTDPASGELLVQRFDCAGQTLGASTDVSGNYGAYWRAREYRPAAPRTKAAVLYVHGLRDFNVVPMTIAGWFDRLPKTTPHKGIFGVFAHAFPNDGEGVEPDWARDDWMPMAAAWFDRYLKGLKTGVERWPAVQVQDNLGQWRALREFPTTGGPVGQLALGPGGGLGAVRPAGSTSYREQLTPGTSASSQRAVFETPSLKRRLHITGQPVLDLWVTLDRPDAHVAAALEVMDRDGQVMRHSGSPSSSPLDPILFPTPTMGTYGVRSLQHIRPMRRGWFEQEEAVPAPVGTPIRTSIRFFPTDLVVPAGSRIRLTVSGSVFVPSAAFGKVSEPSASATNVTILHDCRHTTALRFLLPHPDDRLLNVREIDEVGKELASRTSTIGRRDGGGLATRRVCGKPPARISLLESGKER